MASSIESSSFTAHKRSTAARTRSGARDTEPRTWITRSTSTSTRRGGPAAKARRRADASGSSAVDAELSPRD